MQKVVKLNTSFADNLTFISMQGQEQISSLYKFNVQAISKKEAGIDIKDLLGKTVDLEIEVVNGGKRYLSGDVVKVRNLGLAQTEADYIKYELQLMPWFWYLTRNKDCKIYQQMTVVDILDEVLGSYGGFSYEKKLTASYPVREYCVQYEESDFNFVSRLMEHEGIYYYYKHEAGKVTVILCDDINNIDKLPNYTEIKFNQQDSVKATDEVIYQWYAGEELQGIEYVVNDYDYEKSKVDLKQTGNARTTISQANREIFDWQAGYKEIGDGEHYVKVRLEEERTLAIMGGGATNVRGFAPGFVFKLQDAVIKEDNKDYLIVSAYYNLRVADHSMHDGASIFDINFQVQASEHQYRASSLTDLPKTRGPQTAIVTGPAGSEIYTDEFQRIKVHFIWDRYNEPDENSSCWIRVSNDFAGDKFGALSPPRIGQEVIVDFIGGNPDRPVVVGRVYNDKKMPGEVFNPSPTTSGWIVQSFGKDSTTENASHFVIDADKGNELIDIHAEKDYYATVENDKIEKVGGNKIVDIEGHLNTYINEAEYRTINDMQMINVTKQAFHNYKDDFYKTVDGSQIETITKDTSLRVTEGDYRKEITKGDYEKNILAGTETKTVQGKSTQTYKTGREVVVETGKYDIFVKNDDYTLTVEGDKKEKIKGDSVVHWFGKSLTLKHQPENTVGYSSKTSVLVGYAAEIFCGGKSTCHVGGKSDIFSGREFKVNFSKVLKFIKEEEIKYIFDEKKVVKDTYIKAYQIKEMAVRKKATLSNYTLKGFNYNMQMQKQKLEATAFNLKVKTLATIKGNIVKIG